MSLTSRLSAMKNPITAMKMPFLKVVSPAKIPQKTQKLRQVSKNAERKYRESKNSI